MNAWQRYHWLWHVFFVADFVVTVAVLLFDNGMTSRTLLAIVALAVIGAMWVVFGRREYEGGRAIAVTVVLLGLAAVAILADPAAGFALFAVCPMVFMIAPLPMAVVGTVAATLMPPLSVLLAHGTTDPALSVLVPMTAMLVVFGVCTGLWFERVIRQSRERLALLSELEVNRALVAHLSHEAGASAERERLAGEIHDTLAQGFTSIVTLLQAVESEWDDPAAVRRHVGLAARTARENLAETRAMVAALAPAALRAGPLEDAVRRHVARLAEEWPVEVTCEMAGPLPRLQTASEVVLLRAAQEALANARKHSGARRVSVTLSCVDWRARLVVSDDGVGFDPDAPVDGFGLRGMRARAEQVGGFLDICGRQGTTVTVEVPA